MAVDLSPSAYQLNDRRIRFEQTVLPSLDAAYNLARWLVRDARDADDVVQDAIVRALRYFDSLRGGDARAWLLAIVRNAAYAWLRARGQVESGDDVDVDRAAASDLGSFGFGAVVLDPETLLIRKIEKQMLNEAIAALPVAFREALVLREFEELSYVQIARITDVPIGTVMSRLSRARRLLAQSLQALAHASARETTND